MPIYQCPRCGKSKPIWDIRNTKCNECGYEISSLFSNPSLYQQEKEKKHTEGESNNKNNWIFSPDVDLVKLTEDCASNGSCYNGDHIVLSFDDEIGYNEMDPNCKTNWVKVVWFNDSEKMHPFPLNPDKVKDIKWKCKKCGIEYKGELPGICKKCGKHMWIEEE